MITISAESIAKAQKALAGVKGGAQKALSRSINDGIKRGATVMKREVRSEYLIAYKDVPIVTRLASGGALGGALEVKHDGMLKLYDFRVRPKGVQKRKNKTAISAQVKQSGGGTISHGFVAQMPSGHMGAFVRSSGTSMPSKPWKEQIKELHTINAAIMVGTDTIGTAVQEAVIEQFEARLDHHIARLLK